MSYGKFLAFSALTAALLSAAPVTPAQVSVNIGVAPVCPYGYFDYAPYDCAPYGYYGPDWFMGGAFVGAGPCVRWPHGLVGPVDDPYCAHHRYHGPLAVPGAQPCERQHRPAPR